MKPSKAWVKLQKFSIATVYDCVGYKLLAKLLTHKLGLLRALLRRHPEEVNTPCGFSNSPALVTAASKGM